MFPPPEVSRRSRPRARTCERARNRRRECAAIRSACTSAVSADGVELVFAGSDRDEDATPRNSHSSICRGSPSTSCEMPRGPPQALLHDAEPRLSPVVVDVDAALLEQVVLDLLEDECVDVTQRLRPVRLLLPGSSATSSTSSPFSTARAIAVRRPKGGLRRLSFQRMLDSWSVSFPRLSA